MVKKMQPLHIGLVAAGAAVCVIVAVVVLALHFTGNLSTQAASGQVLDAANLSTQAASGQVLDAARACYTVSAGKDWSGTYYLQSGVTFGGKQTYAMESGAYYLAWDSSASYWTFLTAAQMQGAIDAGIISATKRTAIVLDNKGFPANSTNIFDWTTTVATGTYSESCAIGAAPASMLRRARLTNSRGAVKTFTATAQDTAASRARPRMSPPQINPPRKHIANNVHMR